MKNVMRTWCVNAFAQWSNAPLPSQSERINLFQQWCTPLAWVIVLTNLILTLLLSLFFFYIITLKQSVNVIISVCYCSCWEIGHFKSISFLFNAQLELCLYAVTSVLHHKSKKKIFKITSKAVKSNLLSLCTKIHSTFTSNLIGNDIEKFMNENG